MKKALIGTAALAMLSLASCKGNNKAENDDTKAVQEGEWTHEKVKKLKVSDVEKLGKEALIEIYSNRLHMSISSDLRKALYARAIKFGLAPPTGLSLPKRSVESLERSVESLGFTFGG